MLAGHAPTLVVRPFFYFTIVVLVVWHICFHCPLYDKDNVFPLLFDNSVSHCFWAHLKGVFSCGELQNIEITLCITSEEFPSISHIKHFPATGKEMGNISKPQQKQNRTFFMTCTTCTLCMHIILCISNRIFLSTLRCTMLLTQVL